MPLHVPTPISAIAAGVWSYLPNRRLTNIDDVRAALIDNLDVLLSTREPANDAKLLNLDALISSRATPAQVAALLGNLDVAVSSRSTLTGAQVWAIPARDLTKKVGSEFTLPFIGTISELFNDVVLHSLTTLALGEVIGFPTGATLSKATLLVALIMRNVGGVAQVITPTVYIRKALGAWGAAVLTIPNTISLPALADTPFVVPLLADVDAIITAGGDAIYEVRVDVQASAAADMRYSIEGVLSVAFIGA